MRGLRNSGPRLQLSGRPRHRYDAVTIATFKVMSDGYSDQCCEGGGPERCVKCEVRYQVSFEEVLVHCDHFIGPFDLYPDSILDHQ